MARAVPHAPAPMTATRAMSFRASHFSAADGRARAHGKNDGIADQWREQIGAAVKGGNGGPERFGRSLEIARQIFVARTACARDGKTRGRGADTENERSGVDVA